ncbi:MAG: NADH:ubiquinone oxidoreductase [Theionarchaea archaeon]|nr:NADH:ubiquinone oxidoreductase [Theionarchaea archaeon]
MKPRVAFFDFASCEGCQLQIANLEEAVIDVAKLVDIVSFREVMKEHSNDYDIAVVEGSIMRPMDEVRLKEIRKNAKILVALGACACIGCVQRMLNQWPISESKQVVYGDADPKDVENNPYFENFPTKALDEIVTVDAYIPGCPINRDEFCNVLVALVQGKKPPIPDYPVCVECKKKENVCLFELGKVCMGPVARAGCGAVCPSHGSECEACRGFVDHPEEQAHTEVLKKYGIDLEGIVQRKTMFTHRYVEKKGGESSEH